MKIRNTFFAIFTFRSNLNYYLYKVFNNSLQIQYYKTKEKSERSYTRNKPLSMCVLVNFLEVQHAQWELHECNNISYAAHLKPSCFSFFLFFFLAIYKQSTFLVKFYYFFNNFSAIFRYIFIKFIKFVFTDFIFFVRLYGMRWNINVQAKRKMKKCCLLLVYKKET